MDLTQAVLTVIEVARRAKLNFVDNDQLRAALSVISAKMFAPTSENTATVPVATAPVVIGDNNASEPAVDDSIVGSDDTLSEIKEGE